MAAYPSQAFASYELKSNQPTLVNESVNGRDIARNNGGHSFSINVNHPKLLQSEFAVIDGFMSSVSSGEPFTIVLPDRATPRGVATGTPLVNGALAKGVQSIVTDGWTVSQTGILKAGDLVKFSGHTKVYLVPADCNSDGSGNATFAISPPLREAVSDNETITVNDVAFTVTITNKHNYSVEPPYIYNYSFSAMEI